MSALAVVWFWTLGGMLIAYAVLDGFDLGVGALHLFVARSDRERRAALDAIGPIWNGNEVWLLAAGGMLVPTFPRVYATGFSGFYLALMVALWLLILRGVSIEVRSQLGNTLWRSFWDTGFAVGSALVALLLGVALGNVVRGLPIGEDGTFQGSFALLLNPYSIATGLLALAVLAWHGANYLRVKTDGPLAARATAAASGLWWAAAALVAIVTVGTFLVRDDLLDGFRRWPFFFLLPAAVIAALAAAFACRRRDRARGAFRASTATIVALLGTAAASAFPALLRSTIDPRYSLTVANAASSDHALATALAANGAGLAAVIAYTISIHRVFRGKVRAGGHGY